MPISLSDTPVPLHSQLLPVIEAVSVIQAAGSVPNAAARGTPQLDGIVDGTSSSKGPASEYVHHQHGVADAYFDDSGPTSVMPGGLGELMGSPPFWVSIALCNCLCLGLICSCMLKMAATKSALKSGGSGWRRPYRHQGGKLAELDELSGDEDGEFDANHAMRTGGSGLYEDQYDDEEDDDDLDRPSNASRYERRPRPLSAKTQRIFAQMVAPEEYRSLRRGRR